MLLLIFGCVVVISAGTIFVWQVVSHQPSPRPGNNRQAGASTTQPKGPPPANCRHGFPPSYNETLRQQFAQGVHLSVAQVTAEIRSGKPIQDVAAEQGISADQLFSLELHAYQVADNLMVTIGCSNQYSANLDVQRYRNAGAAQLNYDFTFLFSH
jgi:hypothetical protein